MHILFITPYFPSLIRVRSYNFIKVLKKQGHSIHLVSLVQDKKELIDRQSIEDDCEKVDKIYLSLYKSLWNCLKYLFFPVALQAAYCFSDKMKNHIENLINEKKFDVVHVEHIRGSHFLNKNVSIPAIFDSVDCITALYKQFANSNRSLLMILVSYIEWKKLRIYEPKECNKFDKVLVTSDADNIELKKLNISLPIQIVTNGVDLNYFKPENNEIEPYSIVMTGKMSYFANELAALFLLEEIWPKIKEKVPQAKLYIVGNKPGIKIKRFASSDVIITDYVTDIRLYLAKANMVVVPIVVGAGVQNKILEAMAMGKAIVATSKACEAFSSNIRNCLIIKDMPQEFSDEVINLFNNIELVKSLGLKSRNFVEQNHDWDKKGVELFKIYESIKMLKIGTDNK